MLGLWESRDLPPSSTRHTALAVTLDEVLAAPAKLRAAGIEPLDFDGMPTNEPVVLAWMPAASLYFKDPDNNLLEYIAMLDAPPRPELGIIPWCDW